MNDRKTKRMNVSRKFYTQKKKLLSICSGDSTKEKRLQNQHPVEIDIEN